jgi:5,5'-dehydrodivanillate O-demethylase
VEPSCPHRGTSLEYGWIEGGGLRCCYHGWVFDVAGHCIEQPGEPKGSNFKDKIKLKAYPIREIGGLVFAYMGAAEPPTFPRYDFLVRDDGERTFAGYLRECNFLNQLDNCLDPVHATILHGREVNGARQNPERQEIPEFEVVADELFASYVARRHGPVPGKEWHREVSYTPPVLVIHDGGSFPGDPAGYFADVAWRMPIDDYNTYSFILKFFPFKDGKPTTRAKRNSSKPPPLMRGTSRQFDMTTVNGQDEAAQIGQGAIADRSQDLPNLAGMFFDRERPKTHLEGIEESRERCWAGQGHVIIALNALKQAGPTQDLRIEALGRQEKNREVSRIRRRDVLVTDGFCERANPDFEGFARLGDSTRVAGLGRRQQALVVVLWKLRVHRQEDLSICIATRQLDGEFDSFLTVFLDLRVPDELFGRQELFQQRAELQFTKGAADADVRAENGVLADLGAALDPAARPDDRGPDATHVPVT